MKARKSDGRHVLVLNHFAKPHHASGGTRHVDLFGRLQGWSVRIIASDRSYFSPGHHERSGGLVTVVWTTPYAGAGVKRILNWLTYAVTAMLAGLGGPKPAVVYASTPHLFAPVAGWLLSKVHRAAFIVEVRDLWPQVLVDMGRLGQDSLLHRFLSALEQWAYDRADHIVVLTDGVKHHLLRRGITSERVTVIPNGSNPAAFQVAESRGELRARYGFDGPTFVYTGAHGPANALDLLLDAAEELSGGFPNALFVLVGDGSDKVQLQEQAGVRGLSNVRFLDPVPKDEIPGLLKAADAGLHILADVPLFRYGVSPNKVVDYMAAGIPTVTNSPGVVGTLVERAQSGVAVEPTDLAAAIQNVLTANSAQLEEWGAAGRRYIEAHLSPDVLSADLEDLLDDSLNLTKRTPILPPKMLIRWVPSIRERAHPQPWPQGGRSKSPRPRLPPQRHHRWLPRRSRWHRSQ